jgi:hypothetical protein
MSYNFVRANASVINGSAPIFDYPLTISCWFKTSLNNTNQILVGLYDTGNISNCALLLRPTGLVAVSSRASSSTVFANTSGTHTTNTWHHACGVWSSSSNRTVYLDGGNTGNNTVTRVLNNVVNINIGNSTIVGSVGLQGDICEVAIWNIALSLDNITTLSKFISPYYISRNNLVFYSPLIRNIQDLSGTTNISSANSPSVSAHARMYL